MNIEEVEKAMEATYIASSGGSMRLGVIGGGGVGTNPGECGGEAGGGGSRGGSDGGGARGGSNGGGGEGGGGNGGGGNGGGGDGGGRVGGGNGGGDEGGGGDGGGSGGNRGGAWSGNDSCGEPGGGERGGKYGGDEGDGVIGGEGGGGSTGGGDGGGGDGGGGEAMEAFRAAASIVCTAPPPTHAGAPSEEYATCSTDKRTLPSEPTATSCGPACSLGLADKDWPYLRMRLPGAGRQTHNFVGWLTFVVSQMLTAPAPPSASGTPTIRALPTSSKLRPKPHQLFDISGSKVASCTFERKVGKDSSVVPVAYSYSATSPPVEQSSVCATANSVPYADTQEMHTSFCAGRAASMIEALLPSRGI